MAKITTANARELNARSLEVRHAAKQVAQERENLLKRLLAAEENRLLAAAENPAQRPVNAPDDSYLAERLARVRKQIAGLDAMLEAQTDLDVIDAGTVDRIASAIARLSELERLYAGRPLPGSRRPSAERSKPSYIFTAPTDS